MTVLLAARPDFGFGNPNMAAALFAMLAVATLVSLGKLGEVSPAAFWLRLGLCASFGVLVITTASRGGVAALVSGLFAVWMAAGFPGATRGRAVGIVSVACALLALSFSGRMGGRLAESNLNDGSITSRLAILDKVPAMLVAAPGGWGWGNSAEAYQNWFQEKEDIRIYKHLVSAHATWLTEMGWGLRFAYVLGWIAMLVLCWESPAAFGVWIAFGAAGIFSHVAADARLWAVPLIAAMFAIWRRSQRRNWPHPLRWVACGLASAAILGLLATVGWWQNPQIQFRGSWLRVGDSKPDILFLAPDPRVMGRAYGKLIREQGKAGVVWDGEGLGLFSPRVLILSGNSGKVPPPSSPYDIIWLNPPGRLGEEQRRMIVEARKKTVLWGDLRTDANARELKGWFQTLPGARWEEIRGAGLLLWNLPDLRTLTGNTGEHPLLPPLR